MKAVRWLRRLWPFTRIDEARRHFEQSQSERPEVERLAHDLRARRQRNHFAEQIAAAFREGR